MNPTDSAQCFADFYLQTYESYGFGAFFIAFTYKHANPTDSGRFLLLLPTNMRILADSLIFQKLEHRVNTFLKVTTFKKVAGRLLFTNFLTSIEDY